MLWSGSSRLPDPDPKETCGSATRSNGLALVINNALNDLGVDMGIMPTVISVDPPSIASAVATFGKITIEGFGFDSASKATFGGVPAFWTTFVDNRHVECAPPLGLSGTVDVQVTNKRGEISAKNVAATFDY